jgi:hypothetical protein
LVVAATSGLKTATAMAPRTSAARIGPTRVRSAERPAARTATSSEVRASRRKSAMAVRIMMSGKM